MQLLNSYIRSISISLQWAMVQANPASRAQLLTFVAMTFSSWVYGQRADSIPQPGSYISYGQPAIEDNSMFMEEAFNQDPGQIQHISNVMFKGGDLAYNYSQEIPLRGVKHQLSFGFSYASLHKPEGAATADSRTTSGFGDININYRPLIWGKKDWALIIPRFTLIIPTGSAQYGLGSGGWGGQFNLAVTKRVSRKFTTNYNAGYTLINRADYYTFSSDGTPTRTYERNLPAKNIGFSTIWLVHPKFNLIFEYVAVYGTAIQDSGRIGRTVVTTFNPGFRFSIDLPKVQIVPGFGVPLSYRNGAFGGAGAFFYLSIEPSY